MAVVGGGQAALAVGYYLRRRTDLSFVILDSEDGPGGAWRHGTKYPPPISHNPASMNNTPMMSNRSTPHLPISLDLLWGRSVFGYSVKGRRTVSEENKDMVRRLMEAINEGNMDVVDELFIPQLARPMKRSFLAFRSAFPDWRMEIAELVAEGNTVVGRFRCSGANQGEFKGVPPTGRRMAVDEVYFLRVEDGKFMDFWGLEDDLGRFQQLGLIPLPEHSEEASPT